MRKFKDGDFLPVPTSKNYTQEYLLDILHFHGSNEIIDFNTKLKQFFCWYKWLYWKHGKATRSHRICTRCYKKQKNKEVISKGIDLWINDDIASINVKPRTRN